MYCNYCHKDTKTAYDADGLPICADCGILRQHMIFDRETLTIARSVLVTIPPELLMAMGFTKDKKNRIRLMYQPSEQRIIISKR